jgi:hypothetical protein
MGWSVPYVEYETCTSCPAMGTTIDHGTATVMTLGLGVAPSYRSGRVTYFGGLFARNHPTTQRKELNVDLPSHSGDVEDGPFNLLLDAGVEIELGPWLSALAVIHQDLSESPVRYGPGFGIALTARLGG